MAYELEERLVKNVQTKEQKVNIKNIENIENLRAICTH